MEEESFEDTLQTALKQKSGRHVMAAPQGCKFFLCGAQQIFTLFDSPLEKREEDPSQFHSFLHTIS